MSIEVARILKLNIEESTKFILSTNNDYLQFIIAWGESAEPDYSYNRFKQLTAKEIKEGIKEAITQMPEDIFQEILEDYFAGKYN